MQVDEQQRKQELFTPSIRCQTFRKDLQNLLRQSQVLDEIFLDHINQMLEVKKTIQPEEITELAIALCYAISRKDESDNRQESVQMGLSRLKGSQHLQKMLQQQGATRVPKTKSVQLVGWLSKIWDKMLHFSTYKNYLDLLLLYYNIGDILLYPEQQFKRLLGLLLHSFGRSKIVQPKRLAVTLQLLIRLSEQQTRKLAYETKMKLKIITLLYMSNITDPTVTQITMMGQKLKQINQGFIYQLMDILQKGQQSGGSQEEQRIWDKLFTAVLGFYSKYQLLELIVFKTLVEMINYRLDLQIIKLMIRQLEITSQLQPLKKWKKIFQLMQVALKFYPNPRDCLNFVSQKSSIKYLINGSAYIQLEVKSSTRISQQQKILFSFTDKNRNQQVWLIIRNMTPNEAILKLLRVENDIISDQVKFQSSWNQYGLNYILFQCNSNELSASVNNVQAKMNFSKPIIFTNFIIGDGDSNIGTCLKSLFSLSIYNNKKMENGVCYRMQITNKGSFRGIRRKNLFSFIDLMRMVGDLDIFLMIISHAVKKLKKNPEVVSMIREALQLLEGFVDIKKVRQLKMTDIERQKRLNAILCLCWQCSHETQNALAVLELLRFLSIRGVSNHEDQLQILCNFVFWKQFQWQYQKLIIMKIKELFSQMRVKDKIYQLITKYCQRLLKETALYYRQQQYILSTHEEKDNILKIHYQFIMLAKEQLLYLLKDKKGVDQYENFIEFIVKMMYWTLNRRNNVFDAFDVTFSIELSIFVRQLSQKLKEWRGSTDKILRIIKGIIEVVNLYETQSQFYQQKKIKIYNQERNFHYYDDIIIKQNLYFLAYYLVSLKPNLLLSLIQSDQKGLMEINCVVWQKKIIEPLILSIDKSNFYPLSSERGIQVKTIFERLSLKALSEDQNKLLLTIYLNNDVYFIQKDYRLTLHFCKIINIKALLDIIIYSAKNSKKTCQFNLISKVNESFEKSKGDKIKCEKILSLLASCEDLTYQQGSSVMIVLNDIFDEQFRLHFMTHHFALKGLIEKAQQVHNSYIDTTVAESYTSSSSTNQSSKIQQNQKENRYLKKSFIECLQSYLKLMKPNDFLEYLGIANLQEAQCHLENYKINIQSILNCISTSEDNNFNKIRQYYFFLQKQLLPLSRFYIEKNDLKPIIESKFTMKRLRKGSRDTFQLPKYDIKQQSKEMYFTFLEERNLNLLKVEKVWLQVQERNKSFWSTFIGKEQYFSLYDGTGSFNQKYLLRKDSKKPKLQLPKMILKGSLQRSGSVFSQKFQFNNTQQSTSSIFDDAHLYRKQTSPFMAQNNYDNTKQINKTGNNNKFKVLLVTSSKIYQGVVTVAGYKLIFKQNEDICSRMYEKIFAAECQQRKQDDCIKQNFYFQDDLSDKCIAIAKRYLFHDIAAQVHCKNRSRLFVFNKKDHRQAFLLLISDSIKIVNRDKVSQEIKTHVQKWQNGIISNFSYLMKLNDYTGRSFNDLSQYYIFPWTVTNFQSQIDANFFTDVNNFRDLSKPIGKICKNKWQDIKKKYQLKKQMRSSEMQMPLFLYGSFYSNRAIVCNFLIRINPFSTQHYELQSQQFDAADRLFYSIHDSYKSLLNCSSDFKELIPEFYFFPQFLKNRCAYNLGSRQNKDIVHNVVLPKWASDEYQFVFRMRKMLECEIVSQNLHNWIDLVFGVYAIKKHAIKADNLFLADLYVEGYDKYLLEKDSTSIQLFKQFGQVPVPIINLNHVPIKFHSNFLDSILHPSVKMEQFSAQKILDSGKILQIIYHKKFIIFLFQKQIRLYEDEKFGDKDYVFMNGDFEGGSVRIWQMVDNDNKKRECLIIHKKKSSQILGYQIRKSLFNKFSLEGGQVFPLPHKCSSICIFENFLLCAQDKNIYIYKNIQETQEQQFSTKNFSLIHSIGKIKYLLTIFSQFTHHKSKICFLKATQRGLIVSIDDENKCFVSQLSSEKIVIFNFFEFKSLFFEQKLLEIHLHGMGLIICRTNYDRLACFSFMGDNVVTKNFSFQKKSNLETQKPLNISIWNHELSEIIVGTNLGNLWKIDLFELRKKEVIQQGGIWSEKLFLNREGFRKQRLLSVAVNRIGRHWITIVYAQNNKIYSIRSQKWEQIRKIQILGKKMANIW